MPIDTTAKSIYEAWVYLSSSSSQTTLLSITPGGEATELGTTAAMGWQEFPFLRPPFTETQPTELFDVSKRYAIDHTKKGRDQTKTLSFSVAFLNDLQSLRPFNG